MTHRFSDTEPSGPASKHPEGYACTIIDMNVFKFSPKYITSRTLGGQNAANDLKNAVAKMLEIDLNRDQQPIMIRCVGDGAQLAIAYREAGVVPSEYHFVDFLKGFNSVDPLIEFTHLDNQADEATFHSRDTAELLNIALRDQKCSVIVYAGPISDQIDQIILGNEPLVANKRLVLVTHQRDMDAREIPFPTIQRATFAGIFGNGEKGLGKSAQGPLIEIDESETVVPERAVPEAYRSSQIQPPPQQGGRKIGWGRFSEMSVVKSEEELRREIEDKKKKPDGW